ncbi:MAG: type II toxin-antitoxin system PemK/MazF family toxin [Treponema sp.]|nr:type II toxin-antitoxin system PemK/MazF family toxin [Treponema sp.]
MKPFEIFVAHVSWGSGGKNRPVLVLSSNGGCISVYPITTQYENKSDAIRARYFKMNDWADEGLARQSYIDTGTLIKLPPSAIEKMKPVGRLTAAEKQRLFAFLTKRRPWQAE